MYEVEPTEFGFRLEVAGSPDDEEVRAFVEEVRTRAEETTGTFGVVADFRDLEVFVREAAAHVEDLMEFCDGQGMERSATIVDSVTTKMQIERLVEASGIDDRVVDAADTDDSWATATDWVEDGVEP
jgi:hypothetical protein